MFAAYVFLLCGDGWMGVYFIALHLFLIILSKRVDVLKVSSSQSFYPKGGKQTNKQTNKILKGGN